MRTQFCSPFLKRLLIKNRVSVYHKRHIQGSYFITTPIFYVNADPHIGHLYSALIADFAARFQRLLGTEKILFSTGTDEHGLKVQRAANAANVSTSAFCDRISSNFRILFDEANIGYTDFIRTTEDRHVTAVQHFWKVLQDRGYLYIGNYEGWYCATEETFLSESQLKFVQDGNGNTVKVSAESGGTVEWMTESNYMFRMSSLQDDLLHWIDNGDVVKPLKFQKILRAMIEECTYDVSVSRQADRLPWGITVPGDNTHTVYVWLDALVNYLTVAGYPNQGFRWPPDVQVIGKDILKFHGVYWPAFLIAAGLAPPKSIFCHSHWMIDNEKMSKSRGNTIDPLSKIRQCSIDAVRYFLLREGVPHSDGNYSEKKFTNLVNAELANTMGNLFSRCSAPALNPQQVFPQFSLELVKSENQNLLSKLMTAVTELPDQVQVHYRDFNIYKGLEDSMECLRCANLLLQECKPWEEGRNKCAPSVLHAVLETLRVCGILMLPAVPKMAQDLLVRLGTDPHEWNLANLRPFTGTCSGRKLQSEPGSVLFKRI